MIACKRYAFAECLSQTKMNFCRDRIVVIHRLEKAGAFTAENEFLRR